MLLPKKTIALILGASAIGGGVVAYKYLTSSSSEDSAIEDIQLQRNKEKEDIEKAHNLALKICKPDTKCNMKRTKKILDDNKDLKFDFQIA